MSNPVFNIIQSAFAAEIANDHQVTPHAILIKLPDNSRVIIGSILTTPSTHTVPPYSVRTDAEHTYHYLHQTNDQTNTLQPFILQSIEDCRSYLEDVCRSMINAEFRDFEITFPDGSSYLIVLARTESHNN